MSQEQPIDDDILERAHKEQAELEAQLNARMQQAMKDVVDRLEADSELRHLAYMMLFANRLFNWALAETCSTAGINNEMANVLVKAQQAKALESFDFVDTIKDFQDRQLGWLESKRKDALMSRASREKRLKEFAGAVRKKNIDLPCHSMEALFENNFTHKDMFVVVGERRAVVPILQLCARKYTKAGGHAVLLSSNEMAQDRTHIADVTLKPAVWRNAASIYCDLKELLSGYSTAFKPMGMLVVEDLDNLLMMAPITQSRQQYLLRSHSLLEQYQLDYGGAMILGVFTDEDPEGIDRIQIYPPEILSKHVYVSWQEPKVSDIPSIVVGNDVMLLSEIEKELTEPE